MPTITASYSTTRNFDSAVAPRHSQIRNRCALYQQRSHRTVSGLFRDFALTSGRREAAHGAFQPGAARVGDSCLLRTMVFRTFAKQRAHPHRQKRGERTNARYFPRKSAVLGYFGFVTAIYLERPGARILVRGRERSGRLRPLRLP